MDENLFEKFDKQKNLCQEMLEKIKRNTKLINENRSKYVISSAADKEKGFPCIFFKRKNYFLSYKRLYQ